MTNRSLDISVIIPLYNKAPYIKRAIDLILMQTVPADEIIVVDDGSTDGGGDIVEGYRNSRIKLVGQVNSGESAARNRGAEEAAHELIGFLDADDEWLPDFLETIRVLRNNFPDCGAYATSSYTVKPDGKLYYPDVTLLPPEPWIGIIPNFFALYQQGMAFNSSSIAIPKAILKDIGGFPVGQQHTPDIDVWVRLAIKYPIAISPKRKAVYHQDAINRTAPTHSGLAELPVVGTIRKAIRDGCIAEGELLREALEYIAQKQIFIASNNIMFGNPVYARQLLETCHKTKKYKKEWRFWRVLASFPAGWPAKLLILKQKIIGEKS